VQALTEVDPAQANQMTGHLIQYLRSSLPKMRENTSTIGQEIELVRAYLNILRMRMGDRLAFDIDCPADLASISFPPMMLPSLVENAIKHGLEPQREGGRIDVVVSRLFTATGDRIRVAVKDTGRGLTDAPVQAGGGVGLTNIRGACRDLWRARQLTPSRMSRKGLLPRSRCRWRPVARAVTALRPAPIRQPASAWRHRRRRRAGGAAPATPLPPRTASGPRSCR
jgi:LytS/YehU family sensor histidine kinase